MENLSTTIRPYDPQRDEGQVYGLWQRTLGQAWPLSRAAFHYVTVGNEAYQPGDHVVAQVDREVVGFCGAQAWPVPGGSAPRGELGVVMVGPGYQRQGIGCALLERAVRFSGPAYL